MTRYQTKMQMIKQKIANNFYSEYWHWVVWQYWFPNKVKNASLIKPQNHRYRSHVQVSYCSTIIAYVLKTSAMLHLTQHITAEITKTFQLLFLLKYHSPDFSLFICVGSQIAVLCIADCVLLILYSLVHLRIVSIK